MVKQKFKAVIPTKAIHYRLLHHTFLSTEVKLNDYMLFETL